MASVQIRADEVIKACEKFLNKKQELKPIKIGEDPQRVYQPEFFIKGFKIIERIKKLAEYQNKVVIGEKIPEMSIDHNDFNLIGEYLT